MEIYKNKTHKLDLIVKLNNRFGYYKGSLLYCLYLLWENYAFKRVVVGVVAFLTIFSFMVGISYILYTGGIRP